MTSAAHRTPLIALLAAGCLAAATAPAAAGVPAPTPKKPTAADLAIAKSADKGSYEPGETIAYTITVTNSGRTPVPRADVVVSDPQLADLAPVDGGTDDRLLGPGESVTYAGTRVASVEDCGPLPNTATVALRGGKRGQRDGEPANDSATHWVDVAGAACAPKVPDSVLSRPAPPPSPSGAREAMPQSQPAVCPRPKLRARMTGPRRLAAGQAARFTVAVRNAAGAPAARRARLTLRLPVGFSLATRTRGTRIENGAMQMELGTLAGRRSRTIAVILRADHTLSGTRALGATVSAACGAARATALVRVTRAVPAQVRPPVAG